MTSGYLVPIVVKVCADPDKGQGVFATAPVPKGTLLWKPNHVQAVPAEDITARLAAMPYQVAQVSCLAHQLIERATLELKARLRRSCYANLSLLQVPQTPSA